MVEQHTLTQPGDLTHMYLCGKCSPISIHGNQYFHTFLDDASRRPQVCFLKTKDGAISVVKNYITNLRTQGKNPKALHFDRRKEFVNDDLLTWLTEQGIEIQMMASYSPAQNGAAEQLNRTLIELARTMLLERDVPLFLWEYAIRHAAYLREHAETRARLGTTPYTKWNGKKPNVSHLCEFGTPVFILQQGQKEPPKLQPRSWIICHKGNWTIRTRKFKIIYQNGHMKGHKMVNVLKMNLHKENYVRKLQLTTDISMTPFQMKRKGMKVT